MPSSDDFEFGEEHERASFDGDPIPTTSLILAKQGADKRALIMRRIAAGYTVAEIAQELGETVTNVQRHKVKALRDIVYDSVEEARLIEDARLDAALRAIWDSVLEGNLQAIDRFLRISERRAKLLGLETPPKAKDRGDADDGPRIIEIIPKSDD